MDTIIKDKLYESMKLYVLDNLCVDIILGLVFQKQHQRVTFSFGGKKTPIEVIGLAMLNVNPPDLFANITRL